MTRTLDRLRNQACSALLVALLVSTAIASALFYNGRHIDLFALAGGSAVLAFLVAAFHRSGSRLEIGPLGLLLALHAVWIAIALGWTPTAYMTLIELGVMVSGLALYATIRLYRDRLPQDLLPVALTGLGLILACVMLGQFALGRVPSAMLLNPNSAAGFLNLLWPVAAVACLRTDDGSRSRRLHFLALFVLVTAVAIDGSRGAMLGALAGLAVIASIGFGILGDRGTTLRLVATFMGAFAFANVLGLGAVGSGMASMSDPMLAGASRLTIWDAAWQMVREHPWIGIGPGVFWLAYPSYRHAADGSAGYFVHNDYLEYWVEGGVPGLLLVVAIGVVCVHLFAQAITHYRNGNLARDRLDRVTFSFAGIAAVACHSLFTFNLQLMPFILLLAIVLAEFEHASTAPALWGIKLAGRPLRILPTISLIVLALLPIGHFVRAAAAFNEVQTGLGYFERSSHADAAASYSSARAIWSQFDAPWYLHANVLLEAMRDSDRITDSQRTELVDRATALLDGAEQRNPLRSTTFLIRGLLRADHPDLTTGSAHDALEEAVRLQPRNIEARYALSQVVARDGSVEAALRIVEEGLRINYNGQADTAPLRQRATELRARLAEGSAPGTDTEPERPTIQTPSRLH